MEYIIWLAGGSVMNGTVDEANIDMLIAEWRSGHKFIEFKDNDGTTVVSSEKIVAIAKNEPEQQHVSIGFTTDKDV